MGGIAYLSAVRCSRAARTASFMVRRKVGWPISRQASGESASRLWLVSIRIVSSCSYRSRWASSIFPTVRAVIDVLTWVFTLRACPRREVPGCVAGGCGGAWPALAGWGALGELGFELGDAPVGEPVVGAGGFQPLFQGPVVVGELADALLERGVLGDQPLRCLR